MFLVPCRTVMSPMTASLQFQVELGCSKSAPREQVEVVSTPAWENHQQPFLSWGWVLSTPPKSFFWLAPGCPRGFCSQPTHPTPFSLSLDHTAGSSAHSACHLFLYRWPPLDHFMFCIFLNYIVLWSLLPKWVTFSFSVRYSRYQSFCNHLSEP